MTVLQAIAPYDVRRANARYEPDIVAGVLATLQSGQLILGDRVDAFERAFAAFCGTEHCIGVGNGLDALTLALRALGVGPGHEVIVPAFTFIATWFSVSHTGARPVPVDVRDDGTMDPALLRDAITGRTRAIVPVHLFGRLADMDGIGEAASGLPIVEDAAQAHGARRDGRAAGHLGRMAAFSFYPTKNLGALGDGGAVTCDDESLAHRVRLLSNYGSGRKYQHDILGLNSRLDALQAGILEVKLRDLDAANARRRRVAGRYTDALSSRLSCPPAAGDDMVWHQFVIRTEERERLQAGLSGQGIGTAVHYPVAPFDQPCYAGRYQRERYPVAVRLAETVLSLPMADYLGDEEVGRVIQAVLMAA